jgi:hypothetical protein
MQKNPGISENLENENLVNENLNLDNDISTKGELVGKNLVVTAK